MYRNFHQGFEIGFAFSAFFGVQAFLILYRIMKDACIVQALATDPSHYKVTFSRLGEIFIEQH
jgi:hypothetical protein